MISDGHKAGSDVSLDRRVPILQYFLSKAMQYGLNTECYLERVDLTMGKRVREPNC